MNELTNNVSTKSFLGLNLSKGKLSRMEQKRALDSYLQRPAHLYSIKQI